MGRGRKKLDVKRVCYSCDSYQTYRNHWYENAPIGWFCSRCNAKYITNPKWKPIYKPSRLNFLGREIMLPWCKRTGYCSHCTNNIYDGSTTKTEWHHVYYVPCLPWYSMTELCIRCHWIVTLLRRQQANVL